MKRVVLIFWVLLLLIQSCASFVDKESTPSMIAEDCANAIILKDSEKIVDYFSTRTKKIIVDYFEMTIFSIMDDIENKKIFEKVLGMSCEDYVNLSLDDKLLVIIEEFLFEDITYSNFKILNEVINGNIAIITYQEDGEIDKVVLIKEADSWKIDLLYETSTPSLTVDHFAETLEENNYEDIVECLSTESIESEAEINSIYILFALEDQTVKLEIEEKLGMIIEDFEILDNNEKLVKIFEIFPRLYEEFELKFEFLSDFEIANIIVEGDKAIVVVESDGEREEIQLIRESFGWRVVLLLTI